MKIKTIIIIIILIGVSLVHTLFNYVHKGNEASIQVSSSIKYKILVDAEESKLYLFENEVLTKTYSCSGGKWSTPSPIGTWKIVSKQKWGEGFGRELVTV